MLCGARGVVAGLWYLLLAAVYGELAVEVVSRARKPGALDKGATLERVALICKQVNDSIDDFLWEFARKATL